MFCDNCGAELTGTEKFCPYCGVTIRSSADVPGEYTSDKDANNIPDVDNVAGNQAFTDNISDDEATVLLGAQDQQNAPPNDISAASLPDAGDYSATVNAYDEHAGNYAAPQITSTQQRVNAYDEHAGNYAAQPYIEPPYAPYANAYDGTQIQESMNQYLPQQPYQDMPNQYFPNQDTSASPPKKKRHTITSVIIAICAVVTIASAAVIAIYLHPWDQFLSSSDDAGSDTQATEKDTQDDSGSSTTDTDDTIPDSPSIDITSGSGADDGSDTSAIATTSDDDTDEDVTVRDDDDTDEDVTVRDDVDSYSWEELSQLSTQIAAASSDADGLEIAITYHLTNSDGTLDGSERKTITLSDGTVVSVQIVGFRHDSRSDGSGKAGITFVFVNAIDMRAMDGSSNSGGWEDSDMRSWLKTDGMDLLPDDLSSQIVAVNKLTNNVGKSSSTSCVSTTSDSLWLLSCAELVGNNISWNSKYPFVNEIFNEEGAQYQLYEDNGVEEKTEILTYFVKKLLRTSSGSGTGKACIWWLRSPVARTSTDFTYVKADGSPGYADSASTSYGVVPGFCL